MVKTSLVAAGLLVASLAPALAGTTFKAWGHDFDLSPFRTVEMQVGVATDRATGHRFNVMKTKSGAMMAIVPTERMGAMPEISDSELMN